MASIKNKTLGEMRLLFIHSRVEYLCLNDLDDDNMDEFNYCEMKLDMSSGNRGNELEVTPICKALIVQCSGVGWLCRDRQRLINMTCIHWESHGQMTIKKIYNMILMHILKNQQPKDAVYNIEHFNLESKKENAPFDENNTGCDHDPFKIKHALATHLLVFHEKKGSMCQICGKVMSKYHLSGHMDKHCITKRFECHEQSRKNVKCTKASIKNLP